MEIKEEEFGGVLVVLQEGDSPRAAPRSHRWMITPEIKSWWEDPVGAMRNIADHAICPRMSAWFRRMAKRGEWRLELHLAYHGATQAGFWFTAPGIRGAEVAPPVRRRLPKYLPPDLAAYYRLVGHVDWMGFGAAGRLVGIANHESLKAYRYEYHGDEVNPAHTYIFGWSPCGDMIVFTKDGRGGWVDHGNGKVHLLGTARDTVNWVYGELMAGRCPDYFYEET